MTSLENGTTKINKLRAKLALAREKHAAIQRELKLVKRKENFATYAVNDLIDEIAQLEIESWGNNPNWRTLLQPDGGMTFYDALTYFLKKIGLRRWGMWADTKQYAVAIGINSGDSSAVKRNAAAIRIISPHITKHKDGLMWIHIFQSEAENCCWTLRFNEAKKQYFLVMEVHGYEETSLDFASLESALQHVKNYIWEEDVIDVEGGFNTIMELQAS